MLAYAHISSLGYLCLSLTRLLYNKRLFVVNWFRRSKIRSQTSFTRRCVRCVPLLNFNFHFTFTVKNYLVKVDRWLENILRQKWKPHQTPHLKPFVTTLTTTNMASCTSPPWPRISRQPLHGNIRHFQNGPNSTSRLILGAVTRGIFTVLSDHFTERNFVGVCDRTFPRNISRVKYPWIRKKVPCYLLWWPDFALLDKLHLKVVFRETFEIVRSHTR